MNTYLLLLLTTYTKNTPFYIPGKNIRIIFYRNIYTAASLYAVSRVSCKTFPGYPRGASSKYVRRMYG